MTWAELVRRVREFANDQATPDVLIEDMLQKTSDVPHPDMLSDRQKEHLVRDVADRLRRDQDGSDEGEDGPNFSIPDPDDAKPDEEGWAP